MVVINSSKIIIILEEDRVLRLFSIPSPVLAQVSKLKILVFYSRFKNAISATYLAKKLESN